MLEGVHCLDGSQPRGTGPGEMYLKSEGTFGDGYAALPPGTYELSTSVSCPDGSAISSGVITTGLGAETEVESAHGTDAAVASGQIVAVTVTVP
ncbi:MAG: hypothetical protein ACYC9D_07845 [Candidatus Dormibacteria bacterium]